MWIQCDITCAINPLYLPKLPFNLCFFAKTSIYNLQVETLWESIGLTRLSWFLSCTRGYSCRTQVTQCAVHIAVNQVCGSKCRFFRFLSPPYSIHAWMYPHTHTMRATHKSLHCKQTSNHYQRDKPSKIVNVEPNAACISPPLTDYACRRCTLFWFGKKQATKKKCKINIRIDLGDTLQSSPRHLFPPIFPLLQSPTNLHPILEDTARGFNR